MKVSRKRIISLLTLVVLTVLLTTSASAVTELTLWTFLNPTGTEPRGMLLNDIVNEFNASQDEVRVSIESIHYSRVDQMAIQATAAGQGPDILNVYTVQLPQHVRAGTVTPLNKYVEQVDWPETDYLFPLDSISYDGDVMALPWELRAWVLYYRSDLLEEAGLESPRTLNELREVAKQLSTPRRQGWVVGFSDRSLAAEFMETFEVLLWEFGGELFNEDGTAAFADQAGRDAMQYLKTLHEDGVYGGAALSMTTDDVIEAFKAGTVAMSFEGSMQAAGLRSGLSDGWNIAMMPVPGLGESAPAPALLAGQTLTIGASSKYPDEAWKFIEFFFRPENQARWLDVNVLPVRASAYATLDPATEQGAELIALRDYALQNGRMTQYPDTFPQLSDILVKAAQRIIYDNAPIERTLNEAASQYNALIR